MNEGQSRREFLKRMGSLLTAAGGSQSLLSGASAAGNAHSTQTKTCEQSAKNSPSGYVLSDWTGDNFKLGHQFRNGSVPTGFPAQPDKKVDFVIVGGGLGGLSAAHYLKDQDFLLLEQYEQLGGQARGGAYQGIDYSWGPAYIGTIDGIYGELYSDLGIAPAKLPPGDFGFYWQKQWFQGTDDKAAGTLFDAFSRLYKRTQPVITKLPDEDTPAAMETADMQKLDSMAFTDYFADEKFDQPFMELLNAVCRSAFCGNAEQLSALAGLFVLGDLRSTNYVFKGGNPAIARALIGKLDSAGSGRLTSGAFVWKVELHEGGANVFYQDKNAELHNVACKHVIMASPPMVAWRQVPNMSDKMKAALMPFKYGSYFVANYLLDKQIFNHSYDNWIGNSSFNISDIILAETPYMVQNEYKPEMGSVLTVYHPYEPSSEGRSKLLEGNRNAFATETTDQLARIVEHLDKHLREIVLTRWGHAIVVPGPSYYAKLRKIAASYDTAALSLAHSTTQGVQCAESAIRAGKFAAERAKQSSAKVGWLVSGGKVT